MQQKLNSGVLAELAQLYAESREDRYFNDIWEMVKPFSIMKCKKYPSIPMEDRISISMMCLYDTLINLKKGKNILTLYGSVLQNRLYDFWGKKMQTAKYKINAEASSLEYLQESCYYQPAYNEPLLDFNLSLFIHDSKLIELEIDIVILLNKGYFKRDIMKQLKLKSEDYNEILENIKNKININYLKESY